MWREKKDKISSEMQLRRKQQKLEILKKSEVQVPQNRI